MRVRTDDGVQALLKFSEMTLWKNSRQAGGAKLRKHPEMSGRILNRIERSLI